MVELLVESASISASSFANSMKLPYVLVIASYVMAGRATRSGLTIKQSARKAVNFVAIVV